MWQRTCPEASPFPLDRPFTLDLQEPAGQEESGKGKESKKDSHRDSKSPAGKEGSVAPPSPTTAAAGGAVGAAGAGAMPGGAAGDLPVLSEEEVESGMSCLIRADK